MGNKIQEKFKHKECDERRLSFKHVLPKCKFGDHPPQDVVHQQGDFMLSGWDQKLSLG